ncbi:MAG TPA: ABC transporter permease [Longimicrobiales bacterium]
MMRTLALETHGELMKLMRMPAYAIPVLLFPTMFYSLFGLSFGGREQATYLIGSYAAFGVIGAALFGLGVGVAVERAQGWLSLKRASPMPAGAYFGSKVVTSMMFGAIITILLAILGVAFGDVALSARQWLLLLVTMMLGAAPFCAMGCALAYLVGPNSAPAVTNLIYLPMSFASGLWVPLEALPKFVQNIAPALPPYHLGRMALRILGFGNTSVVLHAGVLAGFAVVFMAIAIWLYRRDEGVTFG